VALKLVSINTFALNCILSSFVLSHRWVLLFPEEALVEEQILLAEDKRLQQFLNEPDTAADEAYDKGDALGLLVGRLLQEPAVIAVVGTENVQVYNNYVGAFVTPSPAGLGHQNQRQRRTPDGGEVGAGVGVDGIAGPNSSSSRSAVGGNAAVSILTELQAAGTASTGLSEKQCWRPSVLLAGPQGLLVVATTFAQSDPQNAPQKWVPMAVAVARLDPNSSSSVDGDGSSDDDGTKPASGLVVNARGPLPHGLSYVSRLGPRKSGRL
jgi:hypothetical protein